MKPLNFELKNLCRSVSQGSFSTRATRHTNLQLFAEHLHENGYKMRTAKALKPKHIEYLLGRWKAEKKGAGTLKNRMGYLRWWAEQVGKSSIMLPKNEDYGIEQRQSFKGNRASLLDLEKVQSIDCTRVQMSLQLQAAFGLRREEAIKFRPKFADQGDYIALKASWTKGGRARSVPITTDAQRALLDQAIKQFGGDSLIPPDKSYIQQLKTYENQTLKAGINNPHGLRHAYAQNRYTELTGGMLPLVLGGENRADMSPENQENDKEARAEISRELGHNRLDVTNTYLGGAK